MTRITPIALALVLLISPLVAAVPEDTTPAQAVASSWLSALVWLGVLAAVVLDWRCVRNGRTVREPATAAFGVLLALAALSVVARLVAQHGAFLDVMLRGGAFLATDFALFVLARRVARSGRGAAYGLVLSAVVGAAIIAALGVQEYLFHVLAYLKNHNPAELLVRVNATSVADWLAGYLVMVLPVTLAFFLGAPEANRTGLLWGVVLVVQFVAMVTTGSRFALVSLAVGVAVFVVALRLASRRGMAVAPALRRRLVGLCVVVLLAFAVVARPVLHRLGNAQQGNSGAFRVWTWRGAARMAAAHPLLGTGVGTWEYLYPPYALTGFTRLAHNSYLQLADECGVPALLALLATLGLVGAAAGRGIRREALTPGPSPNSGRGEEETRGGRGKRTGRTARGTVDGGVREAGGGREDAEPSWLSAVVGGDDRLLLCGLLGGLAAGVVQNLIDSDWSVFFIGATFWALAGVGVGLASRSPVIEGSRGRPALAAAGVASVLLLGLTFSEGMAARCAGPDASGGLAEAEAALAAALSWDPLNGRYHSDLGYKVYAAQGNLAAAERELRAAEALLPSGPVRLRLGRVLESEGRPDEARAVYERGVRGEPNSLDLWLALARVSPPAEALDVYRRIAALERTPVGTVPAIGEVTDPRWAIATAALGDAAAAQGRADEARQDYARAQARLEAYADQGGSTNPEYQIGHGGHTNPEQDQAMRALYQHVMEAQEALAAPAGRAALAGRAEAYLGKYDAMFPKPS